MKKTITIEGMSCGHCSAAVEKALNAIEGVASATVNLEAKTAEVTLADTALGDTILKTAVEKAGYKVTGIA